MKKTISIFLCIALLFSFVGCGASSEESTTETTAQTTAPAPTALELYADAASAVQAMNAMTLDVTIARKTTVGCDTFEETVAETLILQNLTSGELSASVTGSTTWADEYYIERSEIYTGGTVYGLVDDTGYTLAMPQEEYLSRLTPALLLDPALYETVKQDSDGSIVFSAPTDLENWLNCENGQLLEASGAAELDSAGNLTESRYTASYTQGPAQVQLTAKVKLRSEAAPITAPVDTALYLSVEEPDVLLMIERAYGYLMQAKSVTATSTSTIVTMAGPATRVQQTQLNTYGSGTDLLTLVDTDVQVVDLSTSETFSYSQEERYQECQYTVTIDGEEPASGDVVPADMRAYCQSLTGDDFPILSTIKEIHCADLGGSYLIEYTYSDEYGQYLSQDAALALFQDEAFLDDLASDYRTESATGYLAINPYTGLPTALNVTYAGYHTIEGNEYLLSSESSLNIYAGSLTSYEEITGEQLVSGAPVGQPTPVFYHVTGSNGQEMWLLGTIHTGDERTTKLPQEIQDAFAASDALAVEFDVNSFMEQMESDPELMTQLATTYVYTDGSTTQNHIQDSSLFDRAVQMLKASGNFSSTLALIKPVIWMEYIDSFFMQQGYALTSNFGVDVQLLKMAKEAEKEILDVESGIEQIQMLTGYSDELQELLLKMSLEYDPQSYNAELQDLYELWCAGDEAALIQAIAEDESQQLTGEELALYEEYNKAMIIDRNDAMLAIAQEYLESGDVVFYAVGLAHLLTDNGLVNTLRDAGYTVELVIYN